MKLPKRILAAITNAEGLWTDHAADGRDALNLTWTDVISVARTAGACKKKRDEKREGTYKYSVIGRDTRGRVLYMTGKLVEYEDERIWRVITIHEAD